MRIKVETKKTGFDCYEHNTGRQTYEFKYVASFGGLEIDRGNFWGVDEDEVLRYVERKLNNEIYESFLSKIGEDWFTPYNCNQFMENGEYTICADLHELGALTRKKENGLWMFKKKK